MNQSTRIGFSLLAAAVAWGGCAKHDVGAEPAASQGDEVTPAEASQIQVTNVPTPGQIINILDTVDRGEIAQAEVALKKGNDVRVKEFASQMAREHTDARSENAKLLTKLGASPVVSATSDKLAADGAAVLNTLNLTEPSAFDTTYMKAQLQQHDDVLELLKTQLIPAAKNSDVLDQLKAAQSMVEHHLSKAREIAQTTPVLEAR